MKSRIGNHSFRGLKSLEKLSGTTIPRCPQFVHLVTMEGCLPDLSKVKVNVDRSHAVHRRVFSESCDTVKGLLVVMVGIDFASFPIVDDEFVGGWFDFFWILTFSDKVRIVERFFSSDNEEVKDCFKVDSRSVPGGTIPVPT